MSVFKNEYSRLIDDGGLELPGKIKDIDNFFQIHLYLFPFFMGRLS